MQKHQLTQKQSLRQIISQQTIQLMKLIELSNNGLEEEIMKELEENPALEVDHDEDQYEIDDSVPLDDEYDNPEDTDFDQSDEIESPFESDELKEFYDDDTGDQYEFEEYSYTETSGSRNRDTQNFDPYIASVPSYHEYLISQLQDFTLTEKERLIAQFIIGYIDDSGYLGTDLQTIATDFLLSYNRSITVEQIESILINILHQMDPPGVGARNLQEVLLIQIDRRKDCEHKQLAIQIIRDCFDEFSKKQYPKIIKKLNISKKLLTETLDFITQLNPKPIFHIVTPDLKTQEIIPDFIITVQGNQLDLQLNNPYIPKLKISDNFRSNFMRNQHNISKEQREEAERFIKENIDEASQFIQALNLRELILYNTMKAIMEKQRSYFLTGDIKNLKPMILKDIAEEVNVDISTISRVSNSKYVQTPYGIIPLKQLFSESIGDGKTSSLEIKELIRELIANEDPQRPYQDDEIQKILTEQGYSIARRTVSKYRKQMNIPVSRLRIKL